MSLKPLIEETLKTVGGNVSAAHERLRSLGVSLEYIRQVNQAMSPPNIPSRTSNEEAPERPELEKQGPVQEPAPPGELTTLDELQAIQDDPIRAFLGAIIPQNKVGLMRLRDTAIGNLQGRLDRDGVSNGHLLSLLRLTLEHEAALRALARPAAQLVVNDQRTQNVGITYLVDRLEDLDSESLAVLAKQQPRMLKNISPKVIDARDYEPKV